MGHDDASAVPGFLREYSHRTTEREGSLAGFVRGELAEEVRRYQAGAIDFGNRIFFLTSSHRGSIDQFVSDLLGRMWAVDSEVEHVATLFEVAGGVGSFGSRAGGSGLILLPLTEPVVVTTDGALNQVVVREGGLLAQRMTSPPSAEIYSELAEHASDPLYLAGFFNAVADRGAVQFLDYNDVTIAALVSAYAHGRLSDQAKARFAEALLYRYNDFDRTPGAFLRALAADPVAATAFTRYLAVHPGMLAEYFNAKAGNITDGHRHAYQHNLLAVLAAALPTMTPTEIRGLVDALGKHQPQLTGEELKTLLPELHDFLTLAIRYSFEPPLPGEDLNEWATRVGAGVRHEILPFLRLINSVNLSEADRNALVKSMLQGGYINILTTPLAFLGGPVGVGARVAMWAAINFAVGAIESYAATEDPVRTEIDKHSTAGHADGLAFDHALNVNGGIPALIAELIQAGKIVDGAGNTVRFTGNVSGDGNLIALVAIDPKDYRIVDGTYTYPVSNLITSFKNGAKDFDPDNPEDREFIELVAG